MGDQQWMERGWEGTRRLSCASHCSWWQSTKCLIRSQRYKWEWRKEAVSCAFLILSITEIICPESGAQCLIICVTLEEANLLSSVALVIYKPWKEQRDPHLLPLCRISSVALMLPLGSGTWCDSHYCKPLLTILSFGSKGIELGKYLPTW